MSRTEVTRSTRSGPSASDEVSSDYSKSNGSATSSVSLSASASTSTTASTFTTASTSAGSSDEGSSHDADAEKAPRKLPRLEEVSQRLRHSLPTWAVPTLAPSIRGGTSIFPAPPSPPVAVVRYGPISSPYSPPNACGVAPPLPTLSASAKDISEMDVRAGLRLGVFRASTRLNKEQVMDEIESVRMTSHVELVLLESPQQIALLQDVPPQEHDYEWATVFFSIAEAADLCAALLCQPGRRSKWARVSIQRLPIVSRQTEPYTAEEEQRAQVHMYQMNAASPSVTKTNGATLFSDARDTVLARGAYGWCVLSTGGLFPTLGLAAYLQHRRRGDFTGIDVCAKFDPQCDKDKCVAGGQCNGVHLRSCEQWRLLVPPMLILRKTTPTSSTSTEDIPSPVESAWQEARRTDTLVVLPLPPEIDETAFVYMFQRCDGFRRAQTVRTVDAHRYGVVQFADAASAHLAQQQAISHSNLPVRFVGEATEAVNGTQALAAALDVSSTEVINSSTVPPNKSYTTAPSSTSAVTASRTNPAAVTHAPDVPFPPLPSGWEYGLSRRTMQYFFLQSGKKSTTWKHPVTQEQYKGHR
ncbi:hypothetical protein MNV84_08382 [Leishmania braziliensis]|nr:hypothetical protein MNV84_08382 [Leishmania braziliensis]